MSDGDDTRDKTLSSQKEDGKKGKPSAQSSAARGVLFGESIEVFPDTPLKQYDIHGNKAYSAAYLDDTGGGALVAIVCEKENIPRSHVAYLVAKMNDPHLMALVRYGTMYWPPAHQERYVFIYRDPMGKPLLQSGQPLAMGWKSEDVMDLIVEPMVSALQEFKNKDFVHGAIRPHNMYGVMGGDSLPKAVILGDCLSAPASSSQPSLFEPIDRALSDAIGRGVGTQVDDLYSFGISLAVMLRARDPLEGLNARDVTRKKMEMGSYSAVTGQDRFKGEILELLRGLLHDDPGQRWTLEEVQTWLDGRRLSPKQAFARKKAARPFIVAGQKHFIASVLAMDLVDYPEEAKRVVEDDSLLQWLRRALDDEELADRVEKAIAVSQEGGGPGYTARLTSNLSVALDAFSPIRYKGLHISYNGLGLSMADAFLRGNDLGPFVEIITSNVIAAWLSFSENPNIDKSGSYTRFEKCRRFIRNQKVGDGLERCLYLLCSQAPCLSETVADYYVEEPHDLLHAYDDLCQRKKAPSMFLDRHSVAFLMERDSKMVETCLYDLNVGDDSRVLYANVKCFALIQQRTKCKKVPALSRCMCERMEPVYQRFHDRATRDSMKKNVEALKDSGDFRKIFAVLSDVRSIDKDMKAYKAAVYEFKRLRSEAELLDKRLEHKDTFGVQAGRDWAAIISTIVSIFIIAAYVLLFLSGLS